MAQHSSLWQWELLPLGSRQPVFSAPLWRGVRWQQQCHLASVGLAITYGYVRRQSSKCLGEDSPICLPNPHRGAQLPKMLSETVRRVMTAAPKAFFSQPAQFSSSWLSQPLLSCPSVPGAAIQSHLHHPLLTPCFGLCYSQPLQVERQKALLRWTAQLCCR